MEQRFEESLMDIKIKTVQKLVKTQFPKWGDLEIKPVEKSGHDNRTFHLGDKMTVRLPSGKSYVPQVEKEYKWLPFLQKNLDFPISEPLAKGEGDEEYPFPWTINRYIDGESANGQNISSLSDFAIDLSEFLKKIQKIDTTNAPMAGEHNFYRGGDLSVYHDETIASLEKLKGILPTEKLSDVWDTAISSKWEEKPVWIHGDVAPGNLLVSSGRLCAVIDFGIMGVGDPSCDYAMAWTFFDKKSRPLFLKGLHIDTINRAKGWALWKALITYNTDENAKKTIFEILSELD